ncbi:MAG: hypothetical protein PUF78_04615 [Lachnospiraceae bacterium]|nr:hypothetical protein [Lachnospiraceae bacterium]
MSGYYRHRGYRGGPYYGGRRPRKDGDDCTTSCIVYFILGIIAMPLLGLYLMLKKDTDDGTRVLGGVLLIAGIIFWVVIAAQGS